MPTKEEILQSKKQLGLQVDTTYIEGYIGFVHEAMEEYAKQEALEFISFNREHDFKYMGWYYADVWNEYQKSKLKK